MARPLLGCASVPLRPPLLFPPLGQSNAVIRPIQLSSSAAVHISSSAVTMPSDHHQLQQPHPSFEIVGGARDLFLPALSYLCRPYKPFPLVGWNRHVETIFASFFRSIPEVRFRRQCLRTKDDGAVALDWVAGDDRNLPADSPVLILLVCSFTSFRSFFPFFNYYLDKAHISGWFSLSAFGDRTRLKLEEKNVFFF